MSTGPRIGKNVLRARGVRGMTQLELAQACGWSRGKIAKLETGGYKHVFVDDLMLLVRALRMPADVLIGRPE